MSILLLASSAISAFDIKPVKSPRTLGIMADEESPWTVWTRYHNYSEIIETLLHLNSTYPNIVDVFSIGKSWENRDIYCVRLTNENYAHSKPEVLFVGYHHARELISAELPLYFAVEAATGYGANATITRMLDYCEIYIIIALNADAFDVLQTNEWARKNVHPFDEDADGLLDEDPPDDEDGDGYIEDLIFWNGTYFDFIQWEGIDNDADGLSNEDWIGGVDPNRNYGYQWDAMVESGSPYPEDEDYRGPAPFSEPETRAMRDLALLHDFRYGISFHSGTEVIGYPWGYTTDPTVDDAIFRQIAGDLSALVGAPHGQNCDLYTMSGTWDDWMYANRSTFAFTCEIFKNDSAWQYELGPDPDTFWEKGVLQFFNPGPDYIEGTITRWLPVFTYITERAISEAYDIALLREPATQWNQTYGRSFDDVGRSIIQTSDGGYALAGSTYGSPSTGYDFWLVKVDSSGAVQWNQTYGGVSSDYAQFAVQTGDGGYALTGVTSSFGTPGYNAWLVKTDSSGVMQWNQAYGGADPDVARSVVQTIDGGYALAGYTLSFGAGKNDFWLVKTDSSGAVQWNQTYGGASDDYAHSVDQTGDGGYALTGQTLSFGAGGPDFWLVKTDSSGAVQWNQTYGGAGSDYPHSVLQTSDGGYALAGYTNSYGAGDHDSWLVKTGSSGVMQWNQTYGRANSDVAYSMVRTDDGGYALAGYTWSPSTECYDYWLVKANSTGVMQWNKTCRGANSVIAESVVQTGDGGYALAG
ncbi:MAG: hypothetical protein JSW53_01985, partial [Candidatus Bathyarchaeota archaeon]